MTNVVPFGRRSPEEPSDPHMTGEAVCLACAHTWTAVAPVGAPANAPGAELGMECPRCGSLKGVMRRFVQYVNCPNWHCDHCRSFLFSIVLAKGDVPTVACAGCGTLTNALDIFNRS